MKNYLHAIVGTVALATAFLSAPPTVRANVYATDIKVNGSLYGITNVPTPASPAVITYRINDSSATNVTVTILNGSTTVATIAGGFAFGPNTVSWGGTNNSGAAAGPGTYSVSITAKASGYPLWTQISFDPGGDDAVTGGGTYSFYANGMAVDCNSNSPFYGRVVMGNSYEGGANPVTGAYNYDGIYKMNADGSFADEGGFGYGGYTTDDGFDAANQAGEMPSASFVVPWMLRIGADDRIYMLDYSYEGAVSSFDMEMTNQFHVVIDEGVEGYLSTIDSTNVYGNCPDFSDLNYGIGEFDVTADANGNGALWLCNNDFPNWGVWMFHMINGHSDTNDTEGTQAVYAGSGSSLTLVSSGGCTVDTNLDIFVSQARNGSGDQNYINDFNNWNSGVLPSDNSEFSFADVGPTLWSDSPASASDYSWEAIRDTVVNNRANPTLLVCPMGEGNDFAAGTTGGGLKVLNATNGLVISVTNGATIQTLSNLDIGQAYTCAAWDNVGNVYGASTTRNVWRAWSPPGANTNTTLAVAQVVIPTVFKITGITSSPTTPGCATVTISFVAPTEPATSFRVIGSPTVNGSYTTVSGATITGSAGSYQATFSNCSTMFYMIELPARLPVD